ncbi:MAG: L7Ae/L30e/S12e/Gadd45 family ribosomal protein [Gemmatimonadota bacterium]|nr:L7Ae/L30e/S12e/Gadd45 family ribosomal protein [Gemmatimonadota bacterium]
MTEPVSFAHAAAERRVLEMLGLAARAGALVTGTDAVRRSVREGAVQVVLLATDASPTQRQKLLPLLQARGVESLLRFSRERLGAAVGRGAVSAVGVCNEGFARRIAELTAALPSSQD